MTQHEEALAKLSHQAKEQLTKAKERESELLAKGWRYVKTDQKTMKLVPPPQHYCLEHDDYKEIPRKCENQCEYCKSI